MRATRFSHSAMGVLLTALLVRCAGPPDDQVVLGNTTGSSNGILISGQVGTNAVNYLSKPPSSSNMIDVGSVSASSSNNEVVAFASGHPVAIKTPVLWTAGNDSVNLNLADTIAIAV